MRHGLAAPRATRMNGAMIRFIAPILLALFALPAFAQPCAPGSPCRAGGGEYLAEAPEGAARGAVIFLHGHGGRAGGVIRNEALKAPFLKAGWLFIAAQGAPFREGSKGGSWNARANEARRDDVAFLSAVADDAAARFGAPRGRFLLAGFSAGGMMAWRVACDQPQSFMAYAPVSGLLWRPLPERCAGPAKLFHMHGWSDEVVPLEGRAVAGGRLVQADLFAGLALLRRSFGCEKDAPEQFAQEGAFLIRRWGGCAPGASLSFALHPLGHRTPKPWAVMALAWAEGLKDE